PRVVDHRVDSMMELTGATHEGLHLCLVAHVGRDEAHPQLSEARRRPARAHDDGGAPGDEGFDDRQPDPSGATGDDDRLASHAAHMVIAEKPPSTAISAPVTKLEAVDANQ